MASGLRAVEGCREADFRGMILRSGEAAEVVTLHASPQVRSRSDAISSPRGCPGLNMTSTVELRRKGLGLEAAAPAGRGGRALLQKQGHPRRRHRIAMVAACPFPADRGTPARIFRMADELARRGHQIDVVTYHLADREQDAAFRTHRINDIKSYRKLSPGPTLQKLLVVDLYLASRLIGLLRRSRYDVIHAHHVEGLLAALPARWMFKTPLVFDAHTILETELPHYANRRAGLLRSIGRVIDRHLPGRADRVIAVSDEIRLRMIEHGLPEEKVSVVPNGVEESFFGAPRPTPAARGERPPCIVFAGNLAPYQGMDMLLQAFARCRRQRPDLRLRIVSDSAFDPYEPLALDLGVRDAVDLVRASLDDLPGELAAADVLLNPRIDGAGVPQKLLNYMAAGRPIVSFAGTARHLDHECNALVVADGELDGFAEAILRLIDDPPFAARLGEQARRLAREQLTWTHTAACVEDVYARLVPGSVGS